MIKIKNKKAEFKISTFIIGLILASLFVATLSSLMANLSSKYEVTYNESEIDVFNQLESIQNTTFELQNKMENKSSTSTGIIDLVGGFISDAIDGLKIAKNSYGAFEVMAEQGVKKIGLPTIFKTAIYTIVIILILIGVIISAMLKYRV